MGRRLYFSFKITPVLIKFICCFYISGCSLITASLVYEVAVSSRARDDKDSRGAGANPVVRFAIIYGRRQFADMFPLPGTAA